MSDKKPKQVRKIAVFRKEQGVTYEFRELPDKGELIKVTPEEFWEEVELQAMEFWSMQK